MACRTTTGHSSKPRNAVVATATHAKKESCADVEDKKAQCGTAERFCGPPDQTGHAQCDERNPSKPSQLDRETFGRSRKQQAARDIRAP